MKKLILVIILLIGFLGFSQKGKVTTYRVSQGETISSIARKLGVTPYDLLKLNPDVSDGISIDEVLIVPNKNYKAAPVKQVKPKVSVTPEQCSKSKDSIVDGFLYHKVKPLETLYSLSRKYDVSKRKVRRLNNLSRRGDITAGQILKFPTNKKNSCTKKTKTNSVEIEKSTSKNEFFTYLVKPKDTYYTLTRVYNVSEERLKELNPILKEGLKSGIEIKIPSPKEGMVVSTPKIEIVEQIEKEQINTTKPIDSLIVETPKYRIHKVVAKEGFFKLKQLYGFAKEELLVINPKLSEGLKEGMEIKIPLKIEGNLFKEENIQGRSLNLVLMMPFNLTSNSSFSDNSKASSKLNKVTDFYLGSLMALDSIKKKGLSVNVKVFDTKNSDFIVNNILRDYDFEDTNLVIAPIKSNQFSLVASKLSRYNIPVISPVSKKASGKTENCIKNAISNEVLTNTMLDYILQNISNQNIVIIADEKLPVSAKNKKTFNVDLIKSKLLKHDSINNVVIIRMKEGYIERELFEKGIHEKKENWVILASHEESTASIAVENLAVFNKDFNITLFSLNRPTNINSSKKYKIRSKYLNKLKFQYPTANFNDENSVDISNFNNKYIQKYSGLPTDYSYKGFDSTYDALIRLANKEEINTAFTSGKTYRLISQFNYNQAPIGVFENKGVYIVRYIDYKLEKVY